MDVPEERNRLFVVVHKVCMVASGCVALLPVFPAKRVVSLLKTYCCCTIMTCNYLPQRTQTVTDAQLQHLFASLPGLEYCDIKRDRVTGESKGIAFVNYALEESAAMAIQSFHSMEFPPGSGFWMKVPTSLAWRAFHHPSHIR